MAIEPLRVAIIGAGAAGLSMFHRLQHCDRFSVVIYEQTNAVGGTWVYSESTGRDEYGQPIHSSMYDNLRTNLPKELMAFLDYPFPAGGRSYVDRKEVLQYLNNYCDAYNMRKHIQFLTRVVNVSPLGTEGNDNWEVEVEQVVNHCRTKERFHAVLICIGHYSVPRYPEFSGTLDNFEGQVMHSHDYRTPDIFSGKSVLLVGAGSSGIDIALEATETAKKVYLSHDFRVPFGSALPDNVEEVAWISKCEKNGFQLKDGNEVQADMLLVCTGYEYTFPFLSASCKLDVDQHQVMPLFKHLFHIHRPTLAVLSVPFTTVPFVVSDCQAQLIAAVLMNPSLLPSTEDMLKDTRWEQERRLAAGEPPRHFHKFAYRIWAYLDELMDLGRLLPIPRTREKLHRLSFGDRSLNLATFRELNYDVTETEAVYR